MPDTFINPLRPRYKLLIHCGSHPFAAPPRIIIQHDPADRRQPRVDVLQASHLPFIYQCNAAQQSLNAAAIDTAIDYIPLQCHAVNGKTQNLMYTLILQQRAKVGTGQLVTPLRQL